MTLYPSLRVKIQLNLREEKGNGSIDKMVLVRGIFIKTTAPIYSIPFSWVCLPRLLEVELHLRNLTTNEMNVMT